MWVKGFVIFIYIWELFVQDFVFKEVWGFFFVDLQMP